MDCVVLPQIIAAGVYNSNVAARNKRVSQNRRTTMFEIELPIETGGFSYIDDLKEPIRTNMLIIAKPDQIRHTRFPFQCLYIHIIVGEGVLRDILMSIPNYLPVKDPSPFREIFEQIGHYSLSGLESDMLMLQSLVLKLISLVKREAVGREGAANLSAVGSRVVETAIDYVHEKYSEKLDLKSVANHVCLSPVYFHNLFKSATGKTLHTYVEEVRVKKAIDLLVSTDLTLAQIAYDCGFSSQSYFSYVFRRCTQMTPREYVKAAYRQYDI